MIFGIYTVLKYGLKWYFKLNKMNNDLKWMWFWYFDILNDCNVVWKDMIFWYIKMIWKWSFERYDILILKCFDNKNG